MKKIVVNSQKMVSEENLKQAHCSILTCRIERKFVKLHFCSNFCHVFSFPDRNSGPLLFMTLLPALFVCQQDQQQLQQKLQQQFNDFFANRQKLPEKASLQLRKEKFMKKIRIQHMRSCQRQICYKINVKLHLSRPASAMKISSLPPSQDTSTRNHLRIFQQLLHQMVG